MPDVIIDKVGGQFFFFAYRSYGQGESEPLPLPMDTDFHEATVKKIKEEFTDELPPGIAEYLDRGDEITPDKVVISAFSVDWQQAS